MSFDRIIFEYPEGWLYPGPDPLSRQHLQCYETIKLAAVQLGLGFSARTSLRMADFAPRIAPDNSLLISAHTVGIAKNVVRLKESYLPGYYYFDRTGYSGWAEIAYNRDLQNQAVNYSFSDNSEFLKTIRDEKINSNSSKYQQSSTAVSIVSEKPYIFLALQTSEDFVVRLANIDQIQFAFLLAQKAHENSMQLVVKRHPLCSDRNIERSISRLTREFSCVSLTDASINVLIPAANAVATVNSGVGFEALIMGVPVITAGRSDYSFVTNQFLPNHDLSQYEMVKNVSTCSAVENFLCYYLKSYCLNYSDIENAKRLINRWLSEEYSSMHDIINSNCMIIDDIQHYMAELEKMRRSNMLKFDDISCSNADGNSKGLLNKISGLGQRIFG